MVQHVDVYFILADTANLVSASSPPTLCGGSNSCPLTHFEIDSLEIVHIYVESGYFWCMQSDFDIGH